MGVNLRPAETAFAVRDVHAGDREDVALDDGLLAVGAVSRFHPFEAGHVADINVVQALGAGEVVRFHKRLNGRGRQVRELVLRLELRGVLWIVFGLLGAFGVGLFIDWKASH